MAIVPKFGNSLKLEARASGIPVALGPVYGNGTWVSVRGDGYLVTSTDGVTWTNGVQVLYNDTAVNTLNFINGKFILLSSLTNTSFLQTSTDAVTWTSYGLVSGLKRLDPNTNQEAGTISIKDITYRAGKYWAVSNVQNKLFSSTNLSQWSEGYTLPAQFINVQDYYGYKIASNDQDRIVAIFYGGGVPLQVFSRNNGTTWEIAGTTGSGSWTNVNHIINNLAYGANPITVAGPDFRNPAQGATGSWLAVGNNGMLLSHYNPDTGGGLIQDDWRKISGPANTDDVNWISVTYVNNKWLIIGSKYNSTTTRYEQYFYTSSNLLTWTSITVPETSIINVTEGFSNKAINIATDGTKTIAWQWSTSNLIDWTPLNYRIPNQQPYLDYGQDDRYGNWKTIDFWVYVEGTTYNFTQYPIVSQYLNDTDYWTVHLESQQGGYYPRVVFNSSDTSLGNGGGVVFSSSGPRTPGDTNNFQGTVIPGQWNHIRIVRNTGVGAIYINGQFDTSTSNTFTAPSGAMPHAGNLTIARIGDGYESYRGRDVAYWIDEFTLNSNPLNTPSSSTITVPTQPWTNTDTTLMLLHFDTNYLDDTRIPLYGEAQLSTAFTLTPNPTRKVSATASLESINSIAVQAFAGHPSNIVLQSRFITTADAKRIRTITKELSAVTVQNVAVIRKRLATVNLQVLASEVTTAVRVKPATTNLSTQTLITAVANVKRTAQANLVSTSTLSAKPSGGTLLTAVSRLTAVGNAKRTAQAHFITRSTISARADGTIVMDGYSWTVPAEHRYYIVPLDDRAWTVSQENRNYHITQG